MQTLCKLRAYSSCFCFGTMISLVCAKSCFLRAFFVQMLCFLCAFFVLSLCFLRAFSVQKFVQKFVQKLLARRMHDRAKVRAKYFGTKNARSCQSRAKNLGTNFARHAKVVPNFVPLLGTMSVRANSC